MIHTCVEVLRAGAGELRGAMVGGDAMRCFALAQQRRGVAAQIGLAELVEAADALAAKVAQSMSVADASEEIHALLRLCRRVKAPGRAA